MTQPISSTDVTSLRMSAPNADARTHSPVEQYIKAYQRETATTRRVLLAYPSDRADLQPHERSQSAQQLLWTFVMEQAMALRAVRDGKVLGGTPPTKPESWDGMLALFAQQEQELVNELREKGDDLVDAKVPFFTGPKQMGEYAMMDFLWFMLHDQIHHRGQLSVYLRMAGGKVPSIYGPSGDEPWN
jgi:uncharacterized damage-inducible protein DinB